MEFEPKEHRLAMELPNKRSLEVDVPADKGQITVRYHNGIGFSSSYLIMYAEDLEALRQAIVKTQDFVDGIKAEEA